jgi:acetyltransferase-like isoleucine patch superfamily enzyme
MNCSILDKLSKKGEDVMIAPYVDIRRPELIEIGDHVGIDNFFVCSTGLHLGSYIHISPQVAIIGGKNGLLTMSDFSFLSVGVKIICGSEEFKGEGLIGPLIPEKYKDNVITSPIRIEKYAGVCANSTILPGVTISEGSVIGAHSLVLKDTVTEPWTIYAGIPIRAICKRKKEKMIQYGEEIMKED